METLSERSWIMVTNDTLQSNSKYIVHTVRVRNAINAIPTLLSSSSSNWSLSLSLTHYLNNGNLFRVWAAISTQLSFTITTATRLVVVAAVVIIIIAAAAAAVDHHPVIFRRFNDTRMCLSIGLTLTITLVDMCRCR